MPKSEGVVDDGVDSATPNPPVVWRPRTLRYVAWSLAALLMGAMLLIAVILPPEWKVQDRVAMAMFGVLGVAVLAMLARPKVIATDDQVRVVNCVRTYVLEWAEVVDVRMTEGEPWPTVDLADGTTVGAMGIQSNDGELAAAQLAAFRAMVHDRGEAEEPPRTA